MKRTIDVDKFIKDLDAFLKSPYANYEDLSPMKSTVQETIWFVKKFINEYPIKDVVEVVRCKDCVNRGLPYDCPMISIIDDFDLSSLN